MAYLKIHRDEPEVEAPEPLSFERAQSTWRSTEDHGHRDGEEGSDRMDSIKQVEEALGQVEGLMSDLSEQVDEICEPIRMADWLDDHDDGPWAA